MADIKDKQIEELKKENEELQRIHKLIVNREMKMIELKKRIKELQDTGNIKIKELQEKMRKKDDEIKRLKKDAI